MYRGTEIFKPLNTGWTDENVACVREWVANIFFYRRGGTTIMIDAGYNYERLEEKMGWLGIDPKSIKHILITPSGHRPYRRGKAVCDYAQLQEPVLLRPHHPAAG